MARVQDPAQSRKDHQTLRESAQYIGVTRRFADVLKTFPLPRSTSAGLRREPESVEASGAEAKLLEVNRKFPLLLLEDVNKTTVGQALSTLRCCFGSIRSSSALSSL